MKNIDIASEELFLNIKNQNINVKEITHVGYEWDESILIFQIMIPKNLLGFKLK